MRVTDFEGGSARTKGWRAAEKDSKTNRSNAPRHTGTGEEAPGKQDFGFKSDDWSETTDTRVTTPSRPPAIKRSSTDDETPDGVNAKRGNTIDG